MEKKIPKRMCISCREMMDKKELARIACFEGKISFDGKGKAPGRGAYVCRNTECINKAFKNRLFEKCFDASFSEDEKELLQDTLLKTV